MNPTTENLKDKDFNAAKKQKKSLLRIILSISLLVLTWWIANHPTQSSTFSGSVEEIGGIFQEEIDGFYAEQVRPALHDYQIRNKAAADRAVERITKGKD